MNRASANSSQRGLSGCEYRPNYYKTESGKDLFDFFREGLMSKSDRRGFYKGCILKYLQRYPYKGQRNTDLDKLVTYAERLKELDSTKRSDHNVGNNDSD